jgi:hypothetical protein
MRALGAFLVGAGTAFFLDPRLGKRRRHVARDRLLALARRALRRVVRRTRFASGRVRGLVARLGRAARRRTGEADDPTVIQRIRSDALREAGVSARAVDVRVENGVARLHGSVPSDDAANELVARVADTPGVRDVAATLRVSGSTEVR